jgi:hypothetical protein
VVAEVVELAGIREQVAMEDRLQDVQAQAVQAQVVKEGVLFLEAEAVLGY